MSISITAPQPGAPRPTRTVEPTGGLVRAAADGSAAAWSALVDRHHRMLTAVARRHRLTPAEAEDAEQDVWLALFAGLPGVRDPDRVSGWLASTMRRACLRVLRERRATLPLLDDVCVGAGPGPADVVVRAEERRELEDAVRRLPPRQRAVITALSRDPAPSYEQVAAELCIAVGTVGPTRARALARLRALLTEPDPGPGRGPAAPGSDRPRPARPAAPRSW